MNERHAKDRLQKLKAQIDTLRYQYHVENDPGVTDDIYESLLREVKTIEKKFPMLSISHTFDRVAGKPLDAFKKVTHQTRMLSLNDAFSIDELNAWDARMQKLLKHSEHQYFAELKLDGLAVSLQYEKGRLVQAATRGDGFVGEDITENAKMVRTIPLTLLPPFPDTIEIRGEIIMRKAVLARLNDIHAKEGKPLFANTRNAAAGSIRQLDPRLVQERSLSFFAYDIAQMDDMPVTHSEKHALLRSLGVPVPDRDMRVTSVDELVPFIEGVRNARQQLPYHIDGIVISIDETEYQDMLGVIGKAPRYAVAFKYPAEKATTIVKNITVNVGRTGALTPLAHFEPVLVAGSTVSKATLHNIDQIQRLDIRIGDTVIIQKAGDVIPEVVQVLPEMRTGKEKKFAMPKTCPECKTPIVQKQGVSGDASVAYFCPNPMCPAKQIRSLIHFVSTIGIYEIGPKIIERLKDEGLISDAADIFTLTEADLAGLERFGEKSAQNIIAAIDAVRHPELGTFIASLGIANVGSETAKDLAAHFGTFEKFWAAKAEDFDAISNIGPGVTKSLVDFRASASAQKFVAKLLKNNVVPKAAVQKSGGKFTGKTFVLTGTLPILSRNDAKKMIEDAGGKVSGSVSKHTSYVLAGESPGSKYDEAKKLGVTIIDEEEFLRMVK